MYMHVFTAIISLILNNYFKADALIFIFFLHMNIVLFYIELHIIILPRPVFNLIHTIRMHQRLYLI